MKAFFYEAGGTPVSMTELTGVGDRKSFKSTARKWSNYPGREPVIMPNAITSGAKITPAASGADDAVDVSEGVAYLNGVKTTIPATTDLTLVRGTSAFMISSLIVTSGGAFDIIEGTDSTAFADGRGAAGGPPYVAVDAIECGHIRLQSATAAPIDSDEISVIYGVNRESLPGFTIKYSRVEDGSLGYAGVDFANPLPAVHAGDLPAKVYASYYTPNMARLEAARDVALPGIQGSVASEMFYDITKAYESTSLNAGSLEFDSGDGVSHPYMMHEGRDVWHVYYPNDLETSKFAQSLAKPFFGGNFPAEGAVLRTVTLTGREKADLVVA